MDTDIRALATLAQVYFDAAYDMDADRFASIFHPASSVSSVTRVGDERNVSVTPTTTWLATVRTLKAPRQLGLARDDEILSIDVASEIAFLKLRLQIPPRHFVDMLSCVRVDQTWKIVQKVTHIGLLPVNATSA